ncbi:MAG TPA: PIN domain-containing protein [Phycisphaerae bacterium]|nr:PIN domain-containing protein [Phycisphaerae bacterium]
MILVDAGPLVAIIDRRDRDHVRCVSALAGLSAPMITTWAAFTEAMYLLGDRSGWDAQRRLWQIVHRGDLQLAPVEGDSLERAAELMKRYRNVPMDLADATLVVIAEQMKLRRVFTLDKDFDIYRLPGRQTFEVLP